MRKFMGAKRLWGSVDGPDEDWVKPHVLWLPQGEPQVMEYFRRLRVTVERYPDVITPIADGDLHLTVQSVNQHDEEGVRLDGEQLARATTPCPRAARAVADRPRRGDLASGSTTTGRVGHYPAAVADLRCLADLFGDSARPAYRAGRDGLSREGYPVRAVEEAPSRPLHANIRRACPDGTPPWNTEQECASASTRS
ncbi:hypothetical protein ACFY2N_34145 [Streptomyces rubiginosohelvolus]|uniref:hypothetical protein n=1 Tax=Streptomyces rubiginosohelvolus TaxID=67362 RepID=UPI0036B3DCD1